MPLWLKSEVFVDASDHHVLGVPGKLLPRETHVNGVQCKEERSSEDKTDR
jgi:hypothetical protein